MYCLEKYGERWFKKKSAEKIDENSLCHEKQWFGVVFSVMKSVGENAKSLLSHLLYKMENVFWCDFSFAEEVVITWTESNH